VGPRAGLDYFVDKKIPLIQPAGDRVFLGSPAHNLVSRRTALSRLDLHYIYIHMCITQHFHRLREKYEFQRHC